MTETVEVSANSVEVDTNSTAVSDNLTSSFYQQVPTARNVGSLFYTAPGAVDGGGTGKANPSIGGATGLENNYIADGVGINDSGFGGIGVWSYNYGSLGSGINLTFIQEVQVKTGAFEPKYGKADGGVIQIVTKSGGTRITARSRLILHHKDFLPALQTQTPSGRVQVFPPHSSVVTIFLTPHTDASAASRLHSVAHRTRQAVLLGPITLR